MSSWHWNTKTGSQQNSQGSSDFNCESTRRHYEGEVFAKSFDHSISPNPEPQWDSQSTEETETIADCERDFPISREGIPVMFQDTIPTVIPERQHEHGGQRSHRIAHIIATVCKSWNIF